MSLVIALLGCLLAAALVAVALRRWAVWRWLVALTVLPVMIAGALSTASAASLAALVIVSAGLVLVLWRAAPPLGLWLVGAALLAGAVVVGRSSEGPAWQPGSPTLLLLALVAAPAILAAAGLGRARASRAAAACLTLVVVPAVLALTSLDALAVLTWWPAAGALGITVLVRGRRSAAAQRPQMDDTDAAALSAFSSSLAGSHLPPVAIVIAAYNEVGGLPTVLRSLPSSVCGLEATTIVVDDGSSDGTAAAARAAGCPHVVECATNRGQGAALRLGYRLARSHGAAYVVTTDADGQYDAADIPVVLQPIVDGHADFVTGSRRLGVQHNKDGVRAAGTFVFAWLASALLSRRLTDTSFGLRAMRVEVTAAVTLNQPQYQASELVVGVASRGFRVLEVPGTMHVRNQGSSKKGSDLVYGSRYARVLLGTWWREGCPAPLHERAPALRRGSREDRDALA